MNKVREAAKKYRLLPICHGRLPVITRFIMVVYEFGGPFGAAINSLLLPIVVYALYFGCNAEQCLQWHWTPDNWHGIPIKVQFQWHNPIAHGHVYLQRVFDAQGVVALGIWFSTLVILYFIVPAPNANGVILPGTTNKRLQYPLNGWRTTWIVLAGLGTLVYSGYLDPAFGYNHFCGLTTASIIFSYFVATYLFVTSAAQQPEDRDKQPTRILSEHVSGNFIYDYWMGRTLNPRIGNFDLKYFCELRPGLLLWLVLNMSMAAKQYQQFGEVTASMLLVILFQSFYIFDALWSEEAILTTMDITTDAFGLMLVFGDLVWVPYTYTLQARFLADHPVHLTMLQIAVVIAVQAFGFWIFRGSNNQKNLFRTDPAHPSVSSLPFIRTERGTCLLTGGWWGLARHINYLGDLIMGLAWCLPTGLKHPLTYFYVVYFTLLLMHRERRDDAKCRAKYGSDWEKYCEKVPYRIIPYIY